MEVVCNGVSPKGSFKLYKCLNCGRVIKLPSAEGEVR